MVELDISREVTREDNALMWIMLRTLAAELSAWKTIFQKLIFGIVKPLINSKKTMN